MNVTDPDIQQHQVEFYRQHGAVLLPGLFRDWVQDIANFLTINKQIQEKMPKNKIANCRIIANGGFENKEDFEVFLEEYCTVFEKRINEVGWRLQTVTAGKGGGSCDIPTTSWTG